MFELNWYPNYAVTITYAEDKSSWNCLYRIWEKSAQIVNNFTSSGSRSSNLFSISIFIVCRITASSSVTLQITKSEICRSLFDHFHLHLPVSAQKHRNSITLVLQVCAGLNQVWLLYERLQLCMYWYMKQLSVNQAAFVTIGVSIDFHPNMIFEIFNPNSKSVRVVRKLVVNS